jgi:hypothetical protein
VSQCVVRVEGESLRRQLVCLSNVAYSIRYAAVLISS